MRISFIRKTIIPVSEIPIFIIAYNQYTFVKNMVEQLQKYVSSNRIHILDNKSTYAPMVDYLISIESTVHVHRMDRNYGHKVINKIDTFTTSKKYIITDPDLTFNKNLPTNFISTLEFISDKYKSGKVGFALDISSNVRLDVLYNGQNPIEWESQFWRNRIDNSDYELYAADIDTTFCLINKDYIGNTIRIAGNFTCIHRPWLIGWQDDIPKDELDFYKTNNISSCWIK